MISSIEEQSVIEAGASSDIQELVDEHEILSWNKRIESVFDIEVAASFDLDLKIVLAKYAKRSKLDANDRSVVSKSLVKCFLSDDNNEKMRKTDFQRISNVIVQKFPNETHASYYIKQSKKVRARGKLYDAYQHLRADLIKAGLAVKAIHVRTKSQSASDHDETIDETIEEEQPDQTKLLEFLESQIGPWDKVSDTWDKTWDSRRETFRTSETLDYLKLYPALSTNRGLELLANDADKIHPNLPQLMNVLNDLGEKLIAQIRDIGPTYPFHHLVVEGSSQARTNTLILISLPYFMPAVYSRVNNKSVRLSKAEVASSFFPYFQTKSERDTYYEQTVQSAQKQKLHVAPSIHLIGNIDSPLCITTIDGKEYFNDDPVASFELYFKSLFALDLQYPQGSEHVWLFVQKKFFGVSTTKDPKIPAVETLINSL